jgi:lipoprotein-releasing system permease protein
VISLISMLGIMFGTMALIIILSAFNGFEEIVGKLYGSFDSDIKIIPASGKYFVPDINKIHQVEKLGNIRAFTPVIEENALFKYRNNQNIGTFKAIDPKYIKSSGVDSMIVAGDDVLYQDSISYAILGGGISNKLNIHGYDEVHPIEVYVPKKGVEISTLNPGNALAEKEIIAGGIFSIQQDFDTRYVIIPIQFARQLLDDPKNVTALEINLIDDKNPGQIQSKIADIFGKDFKVLNRFEQQPLLYKVMHTEKAAVFLVLAFILLIATFNLIGALLMLALEKQKDMAILISMGAKQTTIQKIITFEGLILSLTGAVIGLILGGLICLGQMKYGWVPLGGEGTTFVINAYPVAFKAMDFVIVFMTVLALGFVASWYPARMARKKIGIEVLSSRR